MDEKKWKETVVISLGGSIIVPDSVDHEFIEQFRKMVLSHVKEGMRFLIITGGGKVCRRYQSAGKELGLTKEDIDWVGIQVTILNGHFMRYVFKDIAYDGIVSDPSVISGISSDIVIGAGWKPGHSTDVDAVLMAEHIGAHKIANLSNIDYVYDKDPHKFSDAQKIEQTTWSEFRKILPTEWSPGLNAPFDPVAAERAERLGIEIAVLNGRNIANLESYLSGKPFKGTLIKPST